jgi:hypothetical protein
MTNVNTDVQKPLVEGPKRQMGKDFTKSGYLVPSPPSTSESGNSTASEPRQTAGKKPSKENTDSAKPPAAMRVEQTPSTSAQRIPASTRNEDETEPDPFAPRPTYFEDRHEMTPILKYFARSDAVAQKECSLLGPQITSILRDRGYQSYCITFSHVGYELETSRPCILVIAPSFADDDATAIVEFVDSSPERRAIRRAFTFEGSFNGYHVDSAVFKAHQRHP